MGELDQLVAPKQDTVYNYNFFNCPTLVGSKLVVIVMANTMDLPERVKLVEYEVDWICLVPAMVIKVEGLPLRLSGIINFQPYTREQLEKIVEVRLARFKAGLES